MDDEIRVQYEGFRPGMYIRLEISSIPCEFVSNFDPHYPIILGGLTSSEGNVGYLQVGPALSRLKSVSRVALLWHVLRRYREVDDMCPLMNSITLGKAALYINRWGFFCDVGTT